MASRLIAAADLLTADFPEVADDWASTRGIVLTKQVITSSTFVYTGDLSKLYVMNSNDSQVVTISDDLTNIPIGHTITFVRIGAGVVTIEPDENVTFLGQDSPVTIADQYSVIKLLKLSQNEFLVHQ